MPHRYGMSRAQRTRKPLPVVTVVCDDTKTAVAYFLAVKKEMQATVTVHVVRAPRTGASAATVVDLAAKHVGDPEKDGDSVWALIDCEAEPERINAANAAKAAGKPRRVNVLLSKPCFEVWTLAHFIDTGQEFSDCAAVVRQVEAEWKERFKSKFDKAKADYSKLMKYRDGARAAAKKQCVSGQSWSEVHILIEEIFKQA